MAAEHNAGAQEAPALKLGKAKVPEAGVQGRAPVTRLWPHPCSESGTGTG